MAEARKTEQRGAAVPGRLLTQAKAVLAVEQFWPVVVALLTLGAAFVTVSWLGVWLLVPPLARVLGVFAFVAGAVVIVLLAIRQGWPSSTAAVARLDRDSGLPHRPVTTAGDALANAGSDPATRALWDLHRKRLNAIVARVKVAPPAPGVARRDRYAVRAAALLVLVAAGFVAGPDKQGRLAAAFAWGHDDVTAQATRIDAWVDPPGYTGKPPMILLGPDTQPGGKETASVSAPAGSTVVVRAAGRSQVDVAGDGGLRPAPLKADAAGSKPQPAAGETRFTLAGDGHVTITRDGTVVRRIGLSAIPDTPPRIALVGTPKPNFRGSMSLGYTIQDDYGVVGAEARFTNPIVRGKPVTGRALVEPPHGVLALPSLPGGLGEGKTTLDLSDHPWAGAQVTMTLSARDEGGNTGESAPVTLTLPAKPFSNPLARALVEQRRDLVLDPDERAGVATALDALQIAPDLFDVPLGVYLGLRTAQTRLAAAKTDADLVDVAEFLWQMALRIENGDLSETEQDLRAAQKALHDAIERGASPDEIKKLTEALRQQMDKFLAEMMQNRQQEQVENQTAAPNKNSRTVTEKDLKSLMDRMEQATRNGDMAEAQRLLDQLNSIMENLKTANRSQAQSQATRDLNKSMNDLDKMMREQGDVRDKTFKQGRQKGAGADKATPDGSDQGMGQGSDQDEDAAGDDSGQGGEQGQPKGSAGKPGFGDLRSRQGALRQQLQEMEKRLKGLGMKGEQGLADAEDAMNQAEGALGRGDGRSAVEAQGRALEGLQKGSNGLQQQMAEGGQDGQQEGPGGGQDGQSTEPGEDTDPLGRPRQGRGSAQAHDLDVSGGLAARAQQVLEELRRRLGDPTRSQDEQDYLERLLKRY